MRRCITLGPVLLFVAAVIALAGEPCQTVLTKKNIVLPATGMEEPAKARHIDEVVFFEDWENGLNGWVSNDLTDVPGAWHIDDWFAFAGMSWLMADTALYCDTVGYLDEWYMVLDSPPIELPAESTTLSFWHRIGCEIPGGEPPGYDGWDGCNLRISTDDGTTWTVVTNECLEPDYDCNSLYSFGVEHGEGAGVPGWAGQHFNWFLQTADLSPWAGQQVKLRWAFASDAAVSTCWSYPPMLWAFGWQVDNIHIVAGVDTVFSNDGDDDTDWHSATNQPIGGDLWRVADEVLNPPSPPPSGTHYLACNDSITLSYNDNMENEIVSPYIDLRGLDLGTAVVDFMVTGYLGSDPDNFPDCDYWHWEVSGDSGATWCFASNPTCDPDNFNYVHPDAPESWILYSEAYMSGFDVSYYIGSVIQIKAVMESNDDDLGGVGPCFDDITLTYTSGYQNDMSCYTLQVRFPTGEGRASSGTAYFVNAGSQDQTGVAAWWKEEGGTQHRLLPNLNLPSGETDTRSFAWTPGAVGVTTVLAWSFLNIDENLDNDTSYCRNIDVQAAAEHLELGYDNRTIQYRFNYETGNGVMVRFTPDEDNVQLPFNLNVIRMQFDAGQIGSQDIGLRIFTDDGGAPGEAVFWETITVTPPDEVHPNWKEVILDGPQRSLCMTGDFWVWLEVLNADPEDRYPQILGDDAEPWEDHEHFFTYSLSGTPEEQPYFYMVRARVTEGVEYPNVGYVTLISPGPPDWGYRLNWISGSLDRLVFTNFCEGTAGSVGGDAAAAGWMATNYTDSIVFTTSTPLTSGAVDTFWLSHPWCSDVVNWTVGDSSGTVEGPLPVELTTFQAFAGDGQVTLRWQTASEQDNDHFVLYKRRSGQADFHTLAEIPGQGTSTEPHDYEFVDQWVQNGLTYQYQISDVDIAGRETFYEQTVSATPERQAVPLEYALHQNYPNPFNPVTQITFDLKDAGFVNLKIYNLVGQEVTTLVSTTKSAGTHTVTFNAKNLPSGIYLYRLEVNDFVSQKKMLLVK
jgi:hypothetical protein